MARPRVKPPLLRRGGAADTSGAFYRERLLDTATHLLRTGRRGTLFQLQMAVRDLRTSIRRIDLAWSLAWHDVVSRYRGSILGPLWITISMALMVVGIGVLNANLFGVPLKTFLPFVALGIVFFGVMAGTINEGCETFVQAAGVLSQTSLPMFTFVWRTMIRNLINLGHHIVIVVVVLVIYGAWREAHPVQALLGLALMVLNAGWVSMLAGIASARFRDIPQVVQSVMQFAIFMTPVFWLPTRLGVHRWILNFNPFYHQLEAVRAPLLGQPVAPETYGVLISLALAGWALTFAIFARTRRRIVHYL
jgi:ABC-type polysaccharide/polyol phosphate export permease